MKKLHATFFYCLLVFTSFISGMEITPIPEGIPQEVGEHIVYFQLLDIHKQVKNTDEAREYLFAVHWVNKKFSKLTNDPLIMRTIIGNLAQTMPGNPGGCHRIAAILNSPGAKRYNKLSKQLLLDADDITPEKIEFLVNAGADVNYAKSWHDNHYYNCPLYHWIGKQHYDNVKKLLELGANVDKPNCYRSEDDQSVVVRSRDNIDITKLLLTYKPSRIGLCWFLSCYDSKPTTDRVTNFLLLVDAMKKRPSSDSKQKELDNALGSATHINNIIMMTALLKAGAQPDNSIQLFLKRIHYNDFNIPDLESLRLLCTYPVVADEKKLVDTRDKLKAMQQLIGEVIDILEH